MNKEQHDKANEIKLALAHFTGTEEYHKASVFGLKTTDGIHYLREEANCYWLTDLVVSHQPKLKGVSFQLWRIETDLVKMKAVVTCKEDTGKLNLVMQKIGYTDFPLEEFEFYCIDGIILLKSEY